MINVTTENAGIGFIIGSGIFICIYPDLLSGSFFALAYNVLSTGEHSHAIQDAFSQQIQLSFVVG
ncbi:MAG: hypothetical protein KBS83_03635, partial [Lachnospiraceae bacterium]|nr:hypothetical protein [Candidatus Equihabitans merdae]